MGKNAKLLLTITFFVIPLLFVSCPDLNNGGQLINSLTINEGDFSLVEEYTKQLSVKILPENAANKKVKWSSDNTGVATVSPDGLVTAIAEGTADITASARDGSRKSDSITVTVKPWNGQILIDSITINEGDFSLAEGNTMQLSVSILPENAANQEIDWSSDEEGVATVSDGLVTAVATGTAIITAAAKDGSGKSGSITVMVGSQIPLVLHWTFKEDIPGWLVFDPSRTPDYPAGTTMNIDAVLPDGMTLLASGRTTRWDPNQTAPVGTDFSDGYIQPNGRTNPGVYSLKIENVKGPFTLTINYTGRDGGQRSRPVIFINGTEVKKGDEANGDADPRSVVYEYSGTDTVTIQLGNVNDAGSSSAGIRIYDIFLALEGRFVSSVLVDSITINEGDFPLMEGNNQQLSVNVLPENAANKGVIWSSGNEGIAKVNAAGLVTAVAEGTAVITAVARDGSGKSGSVTVTVTPWDGVVPVSSVIINEGNFPLVTGDTRQLSVNILPETATNKAVSWSSGDTGVATVSLDGGLVTAIATGTAVITATAKDDSGKSGSITVTVEAPGNIFPNSSWAQDPNLQELKAFPGAEGFGQNVTGGRRGKVVAVTTIDDDATTPPEGSLRWALRQHTDEPITVVFNVSGLIALKGELRVQRNNFTLAGQTAPGDGICIMDDKVNLGGSNNFIIRHLRFRVGTMNNDPSGKASIGIENASNFIIDHCTFGWSGEENTTIYDNKMTTVQWCIVHEGLYQSGHNKGVRGYGTQWGGESATYHHNLLAHNDSRSPRFNGARSNDRDVLIDFVNNVNYNWGRQSSSYGGEVETNSHRVNFVNNYYKPGPAFPGTSSSYFVDVYYASAQGNKTALWYMSGNIMDGSANTGKTADNYSGLSISRFPAGTTVDRLKSAVPFATPPVTTESAQDAFNSVLAKAGAFPRDSVDARIVQEAQNGMASGSGARGTNLGIIDDPVAVGGYPTYNSSPAPVDTDGDGIPDAWETANGLNPSDPADGALKNLSRAYTNLEVYLYDLVRNW